MGNLIVGFLLGIAATTIGFTGLAKYADSATRQVQKVMIEGAKGQ